VPPAAAADVAAAYCCVQVWSYGFTTSASGVPDLEQQQSIDEANWAGGSSSSNSSAGRPEHLVWVNSLLMCPAIYHGNLHTQR
jgi:hypothetical protein